MYPLDEDTRPAEVGSTVHLVAQGDTRMRCIAAIVTNVYSRDGDIVSLVAFGYWTGEQFFHDRVYRNLPINQTPNWHWPGKNCIAAGDP
jgi:hypothetical protein